MLATSFVDATLGRFGYAAVFAFVGVESFGIPLPGETMLIAASLYAGLTHQLDIAVVIIVAAAAAVTGDSIGYGIGRWGGFRLLMRYGRYIRMHEDRIRLARYLFQRHGGAVVFFGRFVAVLRTYRALLAGTARMRWLRFLVFNVAGGAVWAAAYGVAAYYAGTAVQRFSGVVDIAAGAAGVVVIVAGVLLVRNREAQLIERARAAFPGPLTSD